ncbi:hypothetical protein PLESTB_001126200 [Pleodorina starrii]|uniref:S1-like domain-containing protein n=1 Tax=Pleodorina starrii TaxID=330485 RepID=A0A9W6F4Y8_9CHLO|nr:hypothetical protein PLESTM_001363800 [Pleodorina starrii]GLC56607.1 hypothetical protein PLESTB_001126200 [Pleodorina starrii]GLC76195.1 hypothetical protein PLESTF_001748400 [Pleodorina starrii]
MSRSRKHVTLGLDEDVQPPEPGQSIVRALGSRGSNLIAVEFPDGRQTLVLMPAKFNKKLWVKRGGYLLVEDSPAAGDDTKVTGTILSVLYDDQIKQLSKMPGVWPKEFALKADKGSLEDMMPPSGSDEEEEADGAEGAKPGPQDGDEDDAPPLPQNTNRKVVYHEVSESDDEDN